MPHLSAGAMPTGRGTGSSLLALTLLVALGHRGLATIFPKDITPLNVVAAQDSQSYPVFRGLAPDNRTAQAGLDFQRMLRINQTLYVAARDHVYSFDLGLSPQDVLIPRRKLTWKTRPSDMQNCAMRGKRHDECHNFIRVLVPYDDRILFACGTNAFNPVCRNYKMDSLVQEGEELNGQARCPFDTRQTNVALFADGNLYSATMADFLASDAVIYRSLGENSVLRTVKYDSKWLKEPHFVHAIEHGQYVYFFFREIAIEYTTLGRVVFSRVARLCKNDKGGSPRVLEKYWTSFLKARLNCSISGESFFYFDVLESVTDVVSIQGRPAVVAIFTTQANSIPGSAVCAFYMDDIQKAFDGRFKEQRSTDSTWTPVPEDRIPTPRPGCCAGYGAAAAYKSTNEFPDESLSFIKSHPLLDEAVPLIMEKPWLTRTAVRSKLTQIVADVLAGPYQNYTVLFVGTEEGILLKILPRTRQEAPMDGLLLEEVDVYNPAKCNVKGEDRRILALELDKDHHALFVGFSGCVIQVPLSRCKRYSRCKRSCLESRDPYCGWLKSGLCVTLHPGTRSGFEQDVECGDSQHLKPCDGGAPPTVSGTANDTKVHRGAGQPPSVAVGDVSVTLGVGGVSPTLLYGLNTLGVRKEVDLHEGNQNVHINFLIACTVLAFLFGAFLSGLVLSCYCSRALGKAKRPGKDSETALSHTVSLPTLTKLSGLLDGPPKEGKMEGHPAKVYASLLVDCDAGVPLKDGRLRHPELAALPTPDSTPELPAKNVKPFRSQWEKSRGNAKDVNVRSLRATSPSPRPCAPQAFLIPSAVVLPNNAHGRDLSLSRTADRGDLEKIRRVGYPFPDDLPSKAVDISTLDELLKHLHEMSVSPRAAGDAPQAGRALPRVPDLENAAYYTSSTLPRDSLARRLEVPPGPCPQERPARPPSQRHSLATFPKATPAGPGLAKKNSFSQARGAPLLQAESTSPSDWHRGSSSRPGALRTTPSKPEVPPKPALGPDQSPTSPSNTYNQ
ncbi:sema domain, transmembrane domain (TM), and cytoplasmic domain, (semaphorin) 6C isoform X2 [Heptranchias perlo]|uniref:sema domain, transmembrane domain (TM), and cytoplasmic domain, (semaphorin) 6C isoform X2 n=1 Tax=Heptranchias perlo TaxID=212740 RepID=UPI00355A17A6